MTTYYCRRCRANHVRIYQAQPAADPWFPDVRDIVAVSLLSFGIVAGLLWLVTVQP